MKKLFLVMTSLFITTSIYAADRIVQIDSMIEGKVVMCVEPGDKVIKGQPLFFVDPSTLKIQRTKDKDTINYNYKVLNRDKKLAKTHNIKTAELQQAEYNIVDAVQDAKTTEQSILNSYYFAPFDGVITKVINYTGSGIGDGNEVVDVLEINESTNVPAIQKNIEKSDRIAQIDSMTEGMLNLHVNLGEHVKKGQLLFNVNTVPGDDTTYVGPEKIKLENALNYYKKSYNRLNKLYKSRSIKLADLQEAELNLQNAKNDLKVFNKNLKSSYYYSPFKGIVTKIVNYNGCISDGGEIVDVTKIKPNTDVKKIEKTLKQTPQTSQVASIIEGILKLNVKEGQHVKKGELLFNIDTATLENEKKNKESFVKYCTQEYKRQKTLLEKHAVPVTDFEKAKFNLINAVADLKTTELNIKNSYYYSPFDGVVTKVINSDGSAVGDGNEVLDVTKDSTK